MPLPRLVLITTNANKWAELARLMEGRVELHTMPIELTELQGEPELVAQAKCKQGMKYHRHGWVLVEDTSLGFDALSGLPGPYIKPFLERLGPEGLVKLLEPYPDKGALAQCTLALGSPEGDVRLFVGRVRGRIVAPRGPPESWGWDPIFEPEGSGKTLAEMEGGSHRAEAVKQLLEWLEIPSP